MATSTSSKNLSRAELIKRREQLDVERIQLDAAIAAQAQADLQTLVEQFKAHLKTGEFALTDALALLGVGETTRAKRGTTKPKAAGNKPTPGVTYRHPKTGDEWTAPANLRRAKKWLQDLVASSGKKYENFAA
jgi:DNA-binding protein H-NS